MTKISANQKLSSCEQWIRQGKISAVRAVLKKVSVKKETRETRLLVANLARRVGLIPLGMKILEPIIFPAHKSDRPKEAETVEYAILLKENGNLEEAKQLLEQSSGTDGLLAKAWCAFDSWEYAEAIPILEKYVTQKNEPYFKEAGKVNLAEALVVTGKGRESLSFLKQVIEFAKESGYHRLWANALCIRAKHYTTLGDFSRSSRDLAQANALYGESPTADSLTIHRLRVINKGLELQRIEILERFSTVLIEKRDWEGLRELDFHSLKIYFRQEIFDKLYFGTPHYSYRMHLEKTFSRKPSKTFVLGKSKFPLELPSGKWKDRSQLRRQNLRLLNILSRDFYAPMSVGNIFSLLYPNEHFNWENSPNRVHQAVRRLREDLKSLRIPAEVVSHNFFYSLQLQDGFAVRICPDFQDCLLSSTDRLKRQLPNRFNANQARNLLGLSKATVTRILAQAVDSGIVNKIGMGRATQYEFSSSLG